MARTLTMWLRPAVSSPAGRGLLRGMLAAALLGAPAIPAGAGEAALKSFQLRDGSVISGQLLGLRDGHFLVESPSLGQLRIPENDVLAMTTAGAQPVKIAPTNPPAPPVSALGSGGGAYAGEIQAAQRQILSSPELMAEVQALALDPQVQSLANDPAFLNALMSGNLQAIQDNPRTQALMSNPKVQQLIGKVLAGRQP
jgi:hypothetical protein